MIKAKSSLGKLSGAGRVIRKNGTTEEFTFSTEVTDQKKHEKLLKIKPQGEKDHGDHTSN